MRWGRDCKVRVEEEMRRGTANAKAILKKPYGNLLRRGKTTLQLDITFLSSWSRLFPFELLADGVS